MTISNLKKIFFNARNASFTNKINYFEIKRFFIK